LAAAFLAADASFVAAAVAAGGVVVAAGAVAAVVGEAVARVVPLRTAAVGLRAKEEEQDDNPFDDGRSHRLCTPPSEPLVVQRRWRLCVHGQVAFRVRHQGMEPLLVLVGCTGEYEKLSDACTFARLFIA
jgi:hypothetical protein